MTDISKVSTKALVTELKKRDCVSFKVGEGINKRLSKIREKANDDMTAWYGLAGGKKDVLFLLELLETPEPQSEDSKHETVLDLEAPEMGIIGAVTQSDIDYMQRKEESLRQKDKCLLCGVKNDTQDKETPQLCDTCKLETYHEVAMRNVQSEANAVDEDGNPIRYYMTAVEESEVCLHPSFVIKKTGNYYQLLCYHCKEELPFSMESGTPLAEGEEEKDIRLTIQNRIEELEEDIKLLEKWRKDAKENNDYDSAEGFRRDIIEKGSRLLDLSKIMEKSPSEPPETDEYPECGPIPLLVRCHELLGNLKNKYLEGENGGLADAVGYCIGEVDGWLKRNMHKWEIDGFASDGMTFHEDTDEELDECAEIVREGIKKEE